MPYLVSYLPLTKVTSWQTTLHYKDHVCNLKFNILIFFNILLLNVNLNFNLYIYIYLAFLNFEFIFNFNIK